jgi:S1-C subfamily serine protease
MARTPLYSRSSRSQPAMPRAARGAEAPGAAAGGATREAASAAAAHADEHAAPPPVSHARRQRWAAALRRHERWAWAAGAVLLAAVAGAPAWLQRAAPPPTLAQIDQALRESIAKEPLPSAAAAAYRAVLPSLVRVVGEQDPEPGTARAGAKARAGRGASAPEAEPEDSGAPHAGRSVGTGVVIVDRGLILTNLHVVNGADRLKVTFSNGEDSEAVVVSTQPEHDLAVLQAKTLPDDLQAATMRSTSGLEPGDEVIAVGFPFGIGPSVSQGVVSGLKREFRSPEGKRVLTNLIQFDAAANPGNSGGPLVTMDGHVVGIVTAIMNPNQQRTFIGIGFAVPIENAAAGAGLPPF